MEDAMKKLILFSLTMVLLASATVFANSPFKTEGEGPIFYLDYTCSKGLDGSTWVEFYTQVYFAELRFIKSGQGFSATYKLELEILDESREQIEKSFMQDVVEVGSFNETLSETMSRSGLVAFTLEPGEYLIRARLTDLETNNESLSDEVFTVSGFTGNKLMVSSIQLSQKIEPAGDGQFVKNHRYIEPLATRAFAPGVSNICIYFEVYNLFMCPAGSETSYVVTFSFFDQGGKKVAQQKRRQVKPGEISTHSMKFPVDFFESGEYTLAILVRDEATGDESETSTSFRVVAPPSDLAAQ
jgi:hypothetical protein